ncbi:type 1 fimbrial protein [Salmonella enterica]|nr:type 1 fimbrial protein [Salmonella enterica subsp. enterica serovar Oslo]EHW8352258.1 type 1 fimbrial protein [Salmonella enterica]EHW8353108.1 type 1 fimbrial protein [Salmonella enterica]
MRVTLSFLLVVVTAFSSGMVGAADPVSLGFKGNLLDRPCQVAPESASQDVVFFDTPARQFWLWPGKTYNEKFSVKLVNCHASTVGKVVKLVFRGQEETALPGYLKVSGVNAGRLGIGIVDTDGSTLLKLGQVHNLRAGNTVSTSTLTLNFMVYAQATPEAITQKSVVPGDYAATATFELSYL